MRETQWIEWTRTRLQPQERRKLLTALSPEQNAHLLEHDYVWVAGVGVLWKPAEGALRRARFTHGTHFQTRRGEFYIDSAGSARELPDRRFDYPASAASGGESLDNAVPRPDRGRPRRVRGAQKVTVA